MPDLSPSEKPRRLGRGLEALLGGNTPIPPPMPPVGTLDDKHVDLPVSAIRPNPFQPRRAFAPGELQELEASLRTSGMLQPISVRPRGDHYELVAGERRLRAATRLGWQTVPAIVRQFDDREMLTLALVENLQRANLNPMEEADGFFRLIDEFALTQQQVAEAVGKDRSTIANLLRLRQLPLDVQDLVRTGALSAGHARALLSLPPGVSPSAVAHDAVSRQLSVRAVERLGHRKQGARKPAHAPAEALLAHSTAQTRRITDRLRRYLQTDVAVQANARAEGELRIRFYSAEDLDRILTLITHMPNE